MIRLCLILTLLTGCVANIEAPKVNHAKNKEAWEVVKQFQPLPPKKTEPSLEGLKIAYNECLLPYATDKETWTHEEYFATPKEYFSKGKGDCEDFAICVFYKAREMGADATLVFGDNGHPTENHVITEVVIDGTLYIADNTKGRIIKANQFYPMSFTPVQRLK